MKKEAFKKTVKQIFNRVFLPIGVLLLAVVLTIIILLLFAEITEWIMKNTNIYCGISQEDRFVCILGILLFSSCGIYYCVNYVIKLYHKNLDEMNHIVDQTEDIVSPDRSAHSSIHERCSECDKDYWISELEQQAKELTEKLQDYENLGLTPEKIAVLKKKAVPMEVTDIHVDEYYCPTCGAENNCSDACAVRDQYCPRCGQRLLKKEL